MDSFFLAFFSETYKEKRIRGISDKRASEEISFHTKRWGMFLISCSLTGNELLLLQIFKTLHDSEFLGHQPVGGGTHL